MPRFPKHRCCRNDASGLTFKPRGIPLKELTPIQLELEELEAMRLCDHEGKEQEEAGQAIGVSRGTIQRLLASGRHKLLTALLTPTALVIGEKPSCCNTGHCQHRAHR